MKLDKVLQQLHEAKFHVGEKVKMIPPESEGVRPISVEIVQVLSGRCKVLIKSGKKEGEEVIVWNSKLLK